jgi:tRNA U34 5-carboxymethylaminomethyl modifying enzyme MnmG/GidA
MLSCVPLAIWELLQTDFKYEGYAARQSEQNQRLDRKRNQKIPDGLNYDKIAG